MKVVCIKECTYTFNRLDYYFNIGDQFEVALLQPVYYQLSGDKINIVINFIDGKSYAVTVLQEDFISLPEWRNKQLEELLDEF
jgi:hypothetical protein